jgi:hypothetical protein
VSAPSLHNLLNQLSRTQQSGPVAVANGGATDWYEVMLFPPASEEHIASVQLLVGKQLPTEFVQFWRFSNGANLFVNDSGLHGIGLASVGLWEELEREEAEVYGPKALAPYAIFGRVNGAGDFLVFELKTGRVLDGVHAEQPHEWRPIAESFTDWLATLIDQGGRYFWLEALYEAAPADS